MQKVSFLMCALGLIGMVALSTMAISESESGTVTSLISAIPATILCASLFLAGIILMKKKDSR